MRKLASIQKVESIRPIEGADKIVCARILGWDCVVKKGEFKVGESIIYIEVDSCSARDILKEKNIKFVPILDEKFILNKNIQGMVELSKGKTVLDVKPNKPIREGLVLRNYKKDISFKVISPEFLLKNDE